MGFGNDSGKWVRDRYFDNELENPEDADTLIENWGGQRFLPSVTKTETGGQVDPTVTDLVACEGYNGLGVNAYTVDTDFNLETNNDRELYIQVYDFETHKTYKPIRVTNDSVSQSLPQLVRVPNKHLPVKKESKKRKYNEVRTATNNKKGISISQRDEEIESREEYGHWEMDTVVGKKGTNTVLLVFTERKTRQEIIRKIKSKSQYCVVK